MHEVQKNVPIPPKARPAAPRRKYPFDQMQVGDMFFVPGKERNTMTTHVSVVGKKLGKKFITRLCHMRETASGWEPCEATHKDAILGIGVWRRK